jgi:hypothetical protein
MLGFMLARGLGNAAGNALKDKGTDAKDVKPTPCSPWIVGAVVMIIGFIFITSMNGVNPAITPLAIVIGVLLLGGMLGACFSGAKSSVPDIRAPDNGQLRVDALRQHAQQLSCPDQRFDIPKAATMTNFPTMAQLRAEATAPARLPTMNEVYAEKAADARIRRVAAILVDECPTCTAGSGVFCTFHPGQVVHLIDRERSIVVHSSRIGKAVKSGHAKINDVVAQFDNNVPDDVWKYII